MRAWIFLLVGTGLALSGCKTETTAPELKLETLQQKVSYSVGYDIAQNFGKNEFDLDINLLHQGVADAQKGAPARLNEEQMELTMKEFQQVMLTKQQEKMAKKLEENSAAGQAFLAANKVKPDVVTLESGLQYKVLTAGSGKTPSASDVVQVHYRGTLIDGTPFDSSYDRGEPVEFPVSRVIAGWTEALQLMAEGAKWQLFIPAELAYGSQEVGGVIEPNSVLLFEVELLKVVDAAASPAGDEAAEPR